jgi:hypothetical protein
MAFAGMLVLVVAGSWAGAERLDLRARALANMNAYNCRGPSPLERCRGLAAQPAPAAAEAPPVGVRGPASVADARGREPAPSAKARSKARGKGAARSARRR